MKSHGKKTASFVKYLIAIFIVLLPRGSLSLEGPTIKSNEYNSSGYLKLKEGDYASAERDFLRAIRYNPDIKYFYNNIAVACIKQNKYKEADGYLRKAISLDPNYAKALANLAIVSFYRYRFRDAYRYYTRSLSADPAYTNERFERDRVSKKVESIAEQDPENTDLKLILNFLND